MRFTFYSALSVAALLAVKVTAYEEYDNDEMDNLVQLYSEPELNALAQLNAEMEDSEEVDLAQINAELEAVPIDRGAESDDFAFTQVKALA